MNIKAKISLSLAALLILLITLGALSQVHSDTSKMTAAEVETTQQLVRSNQQTLFAPNKTQGQTTRDIVNMLDKFHYLHPRLDNSFSEKVFDGYLEMLDPGKAHLLAADMKEFSKFRHSFDEDLKAGRLETAYAIYNRYNQRRLQRIQYSLDLLAKGLDILDFNKPEYLELERKDLPWLTDINAAKDLWRRLLKNDLLNLKLGDTPGHELITTLEKRYHNQLRVLEQTNSDDVFEFFIAAYTHSYDPHTDYLSPDESENFDMHMRLSLEGIGALLQRDDEYIKVVKLIPAGPAELGKVLQPADRIVAVGQGKKGELQDIEGWRLDDVVNLIRGPKGTVVRLKVIPADSTDITNTRLVTITRDTVKLEEQSAKKKIIDIVHGSSTFKVGVIELPTFYADFEAAMAGNPDYRSSTRDVEKLILELLDSNIDALIIDLRNNGGGSLQEATDMTGLFIRTGPIVQIRDADNDIELQSDLNPKLVYTGPMAVLINRLSASASEIFAGSIQDHGRGIVVGSQSFGKGTVQTINRLALGRLKYTQSKYYRISGDSTQERGVIPDILFPSTVDQDEIGESSLPQAMAWDRIPPARYHQLTNLEPIIKYLDQLHQQRISANPDFRYLNERLAFLEENRAKTQTSLRESERRLERDQMKTRFLNMENQRRQVKGLKPYKNYAELEKAEEDEDRETPDDSMLQEAGDILIDWLILAQKQLALH
ncbi:MAG: carboxy terminal-processing peptidase [Gammaproteobacteria bacterium]|nr:carboxy terminal-processing peptidase [Gammaproteobacteria bacterium]